MMKITYIREDDGKCDLIKDGESITMVLDIDPKVDEAKTVHAIQWKDGEGEIEFIDADGKPVNEPTTDQSLADWLAGKWQEKKDEIEAEREAEREAQLNSWGYIRIQRDRKLSETDWMVLDGAPITQKQKTHLQGYRKMLRDITDTYSDSEPKDVEWPDQPVENVDGAYEITAPIAIEKRRPHMFCGPYQLRAALKDQGMLSQLETQIADSTDEDMKVGWEHATVFTRNGEYIATMQAALELTDTQVDDVFDIAMEK